jgi:predicted Fe-Mo cluster-binding NifX family protein
MKIALTASGSTLDAPLDSRFGRAPAILVYDLETSSFEAIDNRTNVEAVQGAGIQAAQAVVRAGAKAIITGHCGPKAFQVLSAAGVTIYPCDAPTVSAAIERFRAGTLRPARAADVGGHGA